jgi:glycosyltransferase involved in cell wall biosynthesis
LADIIIYATLCKVTMKILFLVPYPLSEAPSQRFRFEQYLLMLLEEGHSYAFESFLSSSNWQLFYQSGNILNKILSILKGLSSRLIMLFGAIRYDFIFIHRETAPFGPPVIEWIIAKILKRKIIYDFDDAIWLTDRKDESSLIRIVKWRNKVASICRWSYKVSCGNEYLCKFAKKFSNNVFHNPTTIDALHLHNPELYKQIIDSKNDNQMIIGWTGSHSTIKYLLELEPVLQNLENNFSRLEFWVIADKIPQLKLKRLRFKPWSKETEIINLAQFDIGIMPLPDDEWAMGKCGFKILQYMALQIPAVASPIGVNNEIIQSGTNGYLCNTLRDWENRLIELIENKKLRHAIGLEARRTVVEKYSITSNSDNFKNLIK